MNTKSQQSRSSLDVFLWVVIFVLIAAGVVGNFYFSTFAISIRLVGWIVLAAILLLLSLQTQFGKTSWSFIKEARIEMRKVTWPTRQETVQTTLVVAAMVVITALILWGIDTFLLWGIGRLTGHTG